MAVMTARPARHHAFMTVKRPPGPRQPVHMTVMSPVPRCNLAFMTVKQPAVRANPAT